jgi:uncharacterized membrane protein (DUF2068 family)
MDKDTDRRVHHEMAPAKAEAVIIEARRHVTPALLVIGIFKLVKAVLLVLAGFTVLHLVNHDVAAFVNWWADVLHMDRDNRHLTNLIAELLSIDRKKLELISAGFFLYAILYGIEGVGLLMDRTWAEWMTVITTAGFVPLEVYEVFHKPSVPHFALLGFNLVILAYLIYRVTIKIEAHAARKRMEAAAGDAKST